MRWRGSAGHQTRRLQFRWPRLHCDGCPPSRGDPRARSLAAEHVAGCLRCWKDTRRRRREVMTILNKRIKALYGIWCNDARDGKGDWYRELPSQVNDGEVGLLAFTAR